jgi:hypothetical protein
VYYDLNEVEIITMDLDLKSLDDKAIRFSDTEIDYQNCGNILIIPTSKKVKKNTQVAHTTCS